MVKLVLLLPLIIISTLIIGINNAWSQQSLLHVVVCDVGQGDAILIQHQSWQLLIDGGVDRSVLRCLDNHLPLMDSTVEVILATHAHADHINGLVAVMEKYHTPLIMTNGLTAETADFAVFSEAVVKQLRNNSQHLVVGEGAQFQFGEVSLNILSPPQVHGPVSVESETALWATNQQYSPDINDHNEPSIVTFLTFGNFSFLATGDLYEAGELALIEKNMIVPTTLVKAGHHGSKTSTSALFLAQSRPEIVAISSGVNNRYGHPAPEVIERIAAVGARIARTDLEGELHFVTDGKRVWQVVKR